MAEGVRVDKWLWSVRVYRTRTAAADACATGRVRVNGEPAKPARRVSVGDRVTARRGQVVLDYEVVELIEKRVGAPIAVTCYVDHTPAAPAVDPSTPDLGHDSARDRGAGRPTKRERRAIDRLRGR